MELITKLAEGFMSLFTAGGETFMGWVSGIIPMVVCLMTFVNSIIKLIGTEKVENFAKRLPGLLSSDIHCSLSWQFSSSEIRCATHSDGSWKKSINLLTMMQQ